MIDNTKVKDKYIASFTDFGFKGLFGEECNKDLLLDFLDKLLYQEEGKIVSLSYLKTERLGLSAESRKAAFTFIARMKKAKNLSFDSQNEVRIF